MHKEILGSIYTEVSDDFQRGIYPIARCVKAEKHDLAVVCAVRRGGNEMEVKQIGNMDADRENFENPQCVRVYDSSGLSPTINTCQGGQREPKIIVSQTRCLNSKGGRGGEDGLQPSVQDRVYDTDGISASITTSYMPSILEKQIVAMRGRNSDNPSDRTAGSPTEQRLETNCQGICNTLTSVQKDNMVLEKAILTPKRTEYGKSIRKAYESGKIKESRHNMTELEPRTDGISNTLTTVQKDNLVLENVCINDRGFSEKEPQISIETIPTLRAETHGNLPKVIETQYRIRKLTPLEVWRLMGFSDEDFRKAEEVNSNSQLYKQAGNSLVKVIMAAIMSQLSIKGVKQWNEMSEKERNDIIGKKIQT